MTLDLLSVKTLVRESNRLRRFDSRTPDDLSAEAHSAIREASSTLSVAAVDLLRKTIQRQADRPQELAEGIIHYLM